MEDGSSKKRHSPYPIISEKCLICGAPWAGGCEQPGHRYPKAGLRVFYKCGASMSIVGVEFGYDLDDDGYCYFLRLKNCNSIDGTYMEGADRDKQSQSENG